ALIMAAGALIRHFFNLRHKGMLAWRYPAAGVALLLATAVWIAPRPAPQASVGTSVTLAQVQPVIAERCAGCHAAQPTQPGFASAPLGVMLDTPERISRQAQRVYQATVQTKSMPLGNLTNMTDEERALIAQWFESGAR